MENKIICKRISPMLSLYIDNKVTYQERAFIEEHLSNCPECYKKYIYLKSLIKDLKDSYRHILDLTRKKQQKKIFNIREHEKFLDELYPYVDNELNTNACIEFRKYLTKSPNAQRQLKNVYTMQKELKSSFEKTQKSFNKDFSAKVIDAVKYQKEKIQERKNKIYDKKIAHIKVVKIALLAGLLMFCGFEIAELFKLYKTQTTIEQQNFLEESSQISEKFNIQNLPETSTSYTKN